MLLVPHSVLVFVVIKHQEQDNSGKIRKKEVFWYMIAKGFSLWWFKVLQERTGKAVVAASWECEH